MRRRQLVAVHLFILFYFFLFCYNKNTCFLWLTFRENNDEVYLTNKPEPKRKPIIERNLESGESM